MARVLAQIWDTPPSGARYLLLDEPTTNLDLTQQHRSLAVARRMARAAVAVLAIMHDMNLASQHADRIMLLRDGEVVALGSPAEVLTPQLIETTFDCRVSVLPHPRLSVPVVFPE